jgi:hypothetical protein
MTQVWTAHEALSWGMYGNEAKRIASIDSDDDLTTPNRTYDVARRELRDAIARGRVTARGFPVVRGQHPPMRETLPADLFDDVPPFAVDVSGETTLMQPARAQQVPHWRGVIFDENQIRALWPRPRADLDKWMHAAAIARPHEKRKTRIDDCVAQTGCAYREAGAAHGRLPPELRRGRGQRIKSTATLK